MTESNSAAPGAPQTMLPKRVLVPVVILLVLFFLIIRFPWDSLARRIEWEIAAASGSRVSIDQLAPALTARGPVLRARNVLIEHPAVERVRLAELEIAPRMSRSWLSGAPTLRVWADSELGLIDGVLGLGDSPSYVGDVSRVELARLPLRLEASGLRLSGLIEGEADIALDPGGTLRGRMSFLSETLVIRSARLPVAIPFTRAEGVVLILDSGATEIESVSLEGEVIEGRISGEIGLVHRSQSPPIDLRANLRIIDPGLRQLAPSAGLPISPNGDLVVSVDGTLDEPRVDARSGGRGSATERANRSRSDRS